MVRQDIPLLPEEELTLNFYNQVPRQWSESHNQPGYWKMGMELFRQLLPSGHILEIGSGGGRDAKELIALGYKYTGTDISTGLLEVARQALPGQTFVQQSVYELSFYEPFDGFWASAVLLHIPRLRIHEALTRIRQTQRVGAVGFISVKDGNGEGVEVETIDGLELARHFTYWDREGFQLVLEENGFEVVDYIYTPRSARTRWHSFFVRAV